MKSMHTSDDLSPKVVEGCRLKPMKSMHTSDYQSAKVVPLLNLKSAHHAVLMQYGKDWNWNVVFLMAHLEDENRLDGPGQVSKI